MGLRDANGIDEMTLLDVFLSAGYNVSVAEEENVFSRFMQVVNDRGFSLAEADSDNISEFISENEDTIFPVTIIGEFVNLDEY